MLGELHLLDFVLVYLKDFNTMEGAKKFFPLATLAYHTMGRFLSAQSAIFFEHFFSGSAEKIDACN